LTLGGIYDCFRPSTQLLVVSVWDPLIEAGVLRPKPAHKIAVMDFVADENWAVTMAAHRKWGTNTWFLLGGGPCLMTGTLVLSLTAGIWGGAAALATAVCTYRTGNIFLSMVIGAAIAAAGRACFNGVYMAASNFGGMPPTTGS